MVTNLENNWSIAGANQIYRLLSRQQLPVPEPRTLIRLPIVFQPAQDDETDVSEPAKLNAVLRQTS